MLRLRGNTVIEATLQGVTCKIKSTQSHLAKVTKLKELTSTLTLVVVPAYVIQRPRIHSCDIGHMQMLDR